MTKKLFVAVLIPKELQLIIRANLTSVLEFWPENQDIQLIQPEDYHFTTFYLGRQEEGRIPEIMEALKEASKNITPFKLIISNISYAEADLAKGMIWAHGESKDLQEIRKRLWEELLKRRIAFEETRTVSTSHINLARFETDKISVLPKINFPINQEIIVQTIYLMESLPIKKGPKYSVIASIDLKTVQE